MPGVVGWRGQPGGVGLGIGVNLAGARVADRRDWGRPLTALMYWPVNDVSHPSALAFMSRRGCEQAAV